MDIPSLARRWTRTYDWPAVNICGTCGCLHRSNLSDCDSCMDAHMKVEMQLALARTRRGLESGIFYGPPIRSQFYESWCLASGIPAHDAVWVGPTPPVLICDLRPDATVMNLTEFTDTLARQVGERFDIDPMLLLQEPPPLIAKAVQCGKTASTLAMLKYLARDPRDERLARLKQRGPAPRGKWWLNRR